MPTPRTAIVVDGDAEERERLVRILAACRLPVLASLAHGLGTAEAVGELRPSIVFVSVEEPYPRALRTIQFISSTVPEATIVAYSTATDVAVFQQVVRAGAKYLLAAPVTHDAIARAVGAATGAGDLLARGGPGGRVITVVGQKGGIGKTAISVNLAAALAQEAQASVLIIDFDTSFGDVGLALDVGPSFTAAKAASSAETIDRESFKASLVEHASGAFVLPAPAHVGEWMHVRPEELEALVGLGAELFDYVIVDTPGAFNDAVAAGVAVADHLFVVTSLEMTSVKNTAMLLDLLHHERYPEGRVLVIANHTSPDTGLEAVDLVSSLGRESVWEVPYDQAVRKASQEGQALVLANTKSPARASLRMLAHRLASSPERIDRRRTVRSEPVRTTSGLQERLRAALSEARLRAAS